MEKAMGDDVNQETVNDSYTEHQDWTEDQDGGDDDDVLHYASSTVFVHSLDSATDPYFTSHSTDDTTEQTAEYDGVCGLTSSPNDELERATDEPTTTTKSNNNKGPKKWNDMLRRHLVKIGGKKTQTDDSRKSIADVISGSFQKFFGRSSAYDEKEKYPEFANGFDSNSSTQSEVDRMQSNHQQLNLSNDDGEGEEDEDEMMWSDNEFDEDDFYANLETFDQEADDLQKHEIDEGKVGKTQSIQTTKQSTTQTSTQATQAHKMTHVVTPLSQMDYEMYRGTTDSTQSPTKRDLTEDGQQLYEIIDFRGYMISDDKQRSQNIVDNNSELKSKCVDPCKSKEDDFAISDSENADKTTLNNTVMKTTINNTAMKTTLSSTAMKTTLNNTAMKTTLNNTAMKTTLNNTAMKTTLNNTEIKLSSDNSCFVESKDLLKRLNQIDNDDNDDDNDTVGTHNSRLTREELNRNGIRSYEEPIGSCWMNRLENQEPTPGRQSFGCLNSEPKWIPPSKPSDSSATMPGAVTKPGVVNSSFTYLPNPGAIRVTRPSGINATKPDATCIVKPSFNCIITKPSVACSTATVSVTGLTNPSVPALTESIVTSATTEPSLSCSATPTVLRKPTKPNVNCSSQPSVTIPTKPNVPIVTKPRVTSATTKPSVTSSIQPSVTVLTKPRITSTKTKPNVTILTKPNVTSATTKPSVTCSIQPSVTVLTEPSYTYATAKPSITSLTKPNATSVATKPSVICYPPPNATGPAKPSDTYATTRPRVTCSTQPSDSVFKKPSDTVFKKPSDSVLKKPSVAVLTEPTCATAKPSITSSTAKPDATSMTNLYGVVNRTERSAVACSANEPTPMIASIGVKKMNFHGRNLEELERISSHTVELTNISGQSETDASTCRTHSPNIFNMIRMFENNRHAEKSSSIQIGFNTKTTGLLQDSYEGTDDVSRPVASDGLKKSKPMSDQRSYSSTKQTFAPPPIPARKCSESDSGSSGRPPPPKGGLSSVRGASRGDVPPPPPSSSSRRRPPKPKSDSPTDFYLSPTEDPAPSAEAVRRKVEDDVIVAYADASVFRQAPAPVTAKSQPLPPLPSVPPPLPTNPPPKPKTSAAGCSNGSQDGTRRTGGGGGVSSNETPSELKENVGFKISGGRSSVPAIPSVPKPPAPFRKSSDVNVGGQAFATDSHSSELEEVRRTLGKKPDPRRIFSENDEPAVASVSRPRPPPPPLSSSSAAAANRTYANEKDKKRKAPPDIPLEDHVANAKDELTSALEQQTWYHGNLDRKGCEALIRNDGQNGRFIVRRRCDDDIDLYPYALSVQINSLMQNIRIRRRTDDTFALGNEKANENIFNDIVEMVNFHRNNSITLNNNLRVTLTSSPARR